MKITQLPCTLSPSRHLPSTTAWCNCVPNNPAFSNSTAWVYRGTNTGLPRIQYSFVVAPPLLSTGDIVVVPYYAIQSNPIQYNTIQSSPRTHRPTSVENRRLLGRLRLCHSGIDGSGARLTSRGVLISPRVSPHYICSPIYILTTAQHTTSHIPHIPHNLRSLKELKKRG
jgi:hypothetical protein